MKTRNVVLVAASAAVMTVALANAPKTQTTTTVQPTDQVHALTATQRADIVDIAQLQRDVPYCEGNPQEFRGQPDACPGGTTTSGGLDSSGFVQKVYQAVGISIARTSIAQYAEPNMTHISASQTKPGDIAWYNVSSDGGPQPAYEAICISNGCHVTIAANSVGVPIKISEMNQSISQCPANTNSWPEMCIMGYTKVGRVK